MPKLCVDIFDLVIDQLRYDKLSLSTCSIVCREWHPRARYHLFHRLQIELAGPKAPKYPWLKQPSQCILPNLVGFLQDTPSVQSLIQELVMTDSLIYIEHEDSDDGSTLEEVILCPLSLETLWSALDLLPMLHALVLNKMTIPANNLMSARGTARQKSLRRLSIINIVCATEWLVPILAHFASIDKLLLRPAGYMTNSPRVSDEAPSLILEPVLSNHLRIKSLTVEGSPGSHDVCTYTGAWSFLPTMLRSLTSLEIAVHFCNFGELKQLLLQRGDRLSHLGLDVSARKVTRDQVEIDLQWDELPLSLCTTLHSFQLHIEGNDGLYSGLDSSPNVIQWSTAYTLLSQLSRATVRRITVSLTLPYRHIRPRSNAYLIGPIPRTLAVAFNWTPLDDIFSRFEYLEAVTFNRRFSKLTRSDDIWSYGGLEPAWRKLLTDKLPSVWRSGKLKISMGGHEFSWDEWFEPGDSETVGDTCSS